MKHSERIEQAKAYAAWRNTKAATEARKTMLEGILSGVLRTLKPLYNLLPKSAQKLVDDIEAAIEE